jgi:hypothetical protein
MLLKILLKTHKFRGALEEATTQAALMPRMPERIPIRMEIRARAVLEAPMVTAAVRVERRAGAPTWTAARAGGALEARMLKAVRTRVLLEVPTRTAVRARALEGNIFR